MARRRRMFQYVGDELRLIGRGASWADRARIARMGAHLHTRVGRARRLTAWLPQPRQRSFDVRLRDGPHLRVRTTDWVIIEVLGVGAYAVDFTPLGCVQSVLDLGANIGTATVFLSGRFPRARFVCVEPAPSSFSLLEENLRRNVPNALALNAAAVAGPGAYHLSEGAQPAETAVVRGPGPPGTAVEALTVTQILARAGLATVDLLKIDIEGSERDVLARAGSWAPSVSAVIGEVHPPLTVEQAEGWLAAHGFMALRRPDEPRFAQLFFAAKPRS